MRESRTTRLSASAGAPLFQAYSEFVDDVNVIGKLRQKRFSAAELEILLRK